MKATYAHYSRLLWNILERFNTLSRTQITHMCSGQYVKYMRKQINNKQIKP